VLGVFCGGEFAHTSPATEVIIVAETAVPASNIFKRFTQEVQV
jgi:hypothetical protein